MEENNLNVAPTEQELMNAGFKVLEKHYFKQVTTFTSIYVASDLSKCELFISGVDEEIELTKQKISDAFALFNQPLPQWEKPRPKIGEVWKNGKTVYLIIDTVLRNTIRVTIVSDNELETGIIVNIIYYRLTKTADSLEEYYKEKFNK